MRMDNKLLLLLFFLVFLSRAFFLSKSPAFFDSIEYLRLAEEGSLLNALTKVHYPIHPLFISLNWLVSKIPLNVESIYKLEFMNAFLGTLSILIIFLLLKEYFNKEKSVYLSLVIAFLPYFWLCQINVLYEPVLILFQVLSLYFLVKYLKSKKSLALVLSSFFIMLSFLVSTTGLFFLLFMIVFALSKKEFKFSIKIAALYFVSLLLGFFIYLYLFELRNIPFYEFMEVFTSSNSLFAKLKGEGILFFPRVIRNSLVVYFNHLTLPLGTILLVLLIKQGRKVKKMFFLVFVWFVLFLGINSYWHAGMFGRTSLIFTLFPVILLIESVFLKKRIFAFLLLICLITSSSSMILAYHFSDTPYSKENNYFRECNNKILIVSNFEEPYLCAENKCLVLNSPLTDSDNILKEINSSLEKNEKVMITSQAISAPYNQYDGMEYHILSKKRNYPKTAGEKIISNYKLELIKQWPEENLKIYLIEKD